MSQEGFGQPLTEKLETQENEEHQNSTQLFQMLSKVDLPEASQISLSYLDIITNLTGIFFLLVSLMLLCCSLRCLLLLCSGKNNNLVSINPWCHPLYPFTHLPVTFEYVRTLSLILFNSR